MRVLTGDVVLLRGHVTDITEDGPVVEYPGGVMRHPAPFSAVAKIERAMFNTGDRIRWRGQDGVGYHGEILSFMADATGVTWAWVRSDGLPAKAGKFATLKTSEIERAE